MSHNVPMTTPNYPGQALTSYSMLGSAPGPRVMAGDWLRLNAITTDATGVLALNGRMMTLEGVIFPLSLSMPFSGTGVQTPVVVPLTDGWIMGFSVHIASGTITDGEVQASVDVVQSTGTPGTVVMSLASGEVTNVRRLGLNGYT